jgi:hypothetical protein
MTNTKLIKQYKAEIDRLNDELIELISLRHDYLTGKRNIYQDYPHWSHLFHKTPMDWLNWRIKHDDWLIKKYDEKIKEIYMNGLDWYEVEYYGPLYDGNIEDVINNDGFIIGIKL